MDFYGFANDAGQMRQIPLSEIHLDPAQPRRHFDEEALQSLAESMETGMLLEPVVVYPEGAGYRLLVGERRFRAARHNGWATIDARVVDKPDHPLLVQLAENMQRQDLLPWEVMLSVERLVADGLNPPGISAATGLSAQHVRRYLRVAEDPSLRQALLDGASLREVLDRLAPPASPPEPSEVGPPASPRPSSGPTPPDESGPDTPPEGGRDDVQPTPPASGASPSEPVGETAPSTSGGGLPAAAGEAVDALERAWPRLGGRERANLGKRLRRLLEDDHG